MEQALHQQKTQALELQNRMERSRLQQLRGQDRPAHFLFNTLNVILRAGQETAYRTQALITALSHLLRYSLMSNDEQVPLSREVRSWTSIIPSTTSASASGCRWNGASRTPST